jgi:hypothetical protein
MDLIVAIDRLKKLQESNNREEAHLEADEILLQLIDDFQVETAYRAIAKWYS